MSSHEESQDLAMLCSILRDRKTACAPEYAVTFKLVQCLSTLENSVNLWNIFKCKTLWAAMDCTEECSRSSSDFTSGEKLDNIKKKYAAKLAGKQDWSRALSCSPQCYGLLSTQLCCVQKDKDSDLQVTFAHWLALWLWDMNTKWWVEEANCCLW